MPDIGYTEGGTVWFPLSEPPDVPADLPQVPETGQAFEWWGAKARDGSDLCAAVGGDCGAGGPYIIGVWCLPPEDCAGRDRPERIEGCTPRYPTFDECVGLVNAACLPGAMLACAIIAGGELHQQPTGRGLIFTQSMVLGGTPAGQRWALAHPGSVPQQGRPGGLIHG